MDQTLGVLGFGFVGGWMGFLLAKSIYSNPVGQNSLTVPYLWQTFALTATGVGVGIISFEQLIKTH